MFKKLFAVTLILLMGLSTLALAEQTVLPATITLEPTVTVGIVGHRAAATAKAEGVAQFRWKSSATKIASVSQKGAVFFKKPGEFTLSAASKGAVKAAGSVTIKVVANRKDTETSRVYLKGNYVYADILYTNKGEKPVKKLGATQIVLSGIEGQTAFEAKRGVAKKAIKAGESGFVSFKLMKADKSKVDLTGALAAFKA